MNYYLTKSFLRGIGQVVFVNNSISSLLILVALFLQSPGLGLTAILGSIASTLTAIFLDSKQDDIYNGMYGYNGVLVAIAIFTLRMSNADIDFWDLSFFQIVIPTISLSAYCTVLMLKFGNWWTRKIKFPLFTLPFILTTWLFLVSAMFFPESDAGHQAISANIPDAIAWRNTLSAIFIGFGQIFFADKLVVGLLIFLAIFVCSPFTAFVGLLGSAVGLGTGLILNANLTEIYSGLWCYNSILSALAISTLYKHRGFSSYLIVVETACVSAIMLRLLEICLNFTGLPILTLPFCLTTIIFFRPTRIEIKETSLSNT